MNRKKLRAKHRQRLLQRLYEKCKGRCTSCNVQVGLVFKLIQKGWELLDKEGILISPTGEVLFVATIEHLTPRAKGGSDNIKTNLTLYCSGCNRKTSHFGRKSKSDIEAEAVEDKEFSEKSTSLWDRVTNGACLLPAPAVDEGFWLSEDPST